MGDDVSWWAEDPRALRAATEVLEEAGIATFGRRIAPPPEDPDDPPAYGAAVTRPVQPVTTDPRAAIRARRRGGDEGPAWYDS